MKLLLLVISFFALVCCRSNENAYEIIDNDNASEWLNDFMLVKSGMLMTIERIPYVLVDDANRDEYIEKLNNQQYIILDNETYFKLTGQILGKEYGLAIRGVSAPSGGSAHFGGSFSISRTIENEYVVGYIVGGIITSYNKTALIIETYELPSEIYIVLGGGGA